MADRLREKKVRRVLDLLERGTITLTEARRRVDALWREVGK